MELIHTSSATQATVPSADLTTSGGLIAVDWTGFGESSFTFSDIFARHHTLEGGTSIDIGTPTTVVSVIASIVIRQPYTNEFNQTLQAWSTDVAYPGLFVSNGADEFIIDAWPTFAQSHILTYEPGDFRIGFGGVAAFPPTGGAMTLDFRFALGMSDDNFGGPDDLPTASWEGTIAVLLGF